MNSFVDETRIEVRSGNGGNGAVSFRREKYVPRGGPDGGDGGKGGDVVFVVEGNLKTLSHLKQKRYFYADAGRPGAGRKKHGKNGKDIRIFVPPGTLVRDSRTGRLRQDLKEAGREWVFLKGGPGGAGNKNFATSRRQAPRFAKPGQPGESRRLIIELNLIADVGLVGLPNAGKSTLLSKITNASPRIAAFPFTTTIPNLGVLRYFDRELIIADIPGIIKGASSGVGLGFRFLKHISRTGILAFLVDLSAPGYLSAVAVLETELGTYAPELMRKERLVVGTKLDIDGTAENLERLSSSLPDDSVFGISAVTGSGLERLEQALSEITKPV